MEFYPDNIEYGLMLLGAYSRLNRRQEALDTIDTLQSGIPNAIKVFEELRRKGHKPVGIRLDSGDLLRSQHRPLSGRPWQRCQRGIGPVALQIGMTVRGTWHYPATGLPHLALRHGNAGRQAQGQAEP